MGLFLSCSSGAKRDLHAAINEGNVEYVEQAAQYNPDLLNRKYSYKLYTPLHAAIACGSLEIVAILLERGADINARDRHGRTPLMISCRKAQWNCVQYLLDNGADVLIFSYYRKLTCLHYAIKIGQFESIQKILTAAKKSRVEDSWGSKPFINIRDRYGVSALHLAACKGHYAVVRLLLEHGALVSATTYTFCNKPAPGSTPLHFAARNGSLGCVQELLAWGADRNHMDYTGFTPYDIALMYRNFTCAALLNPQSSEPLVWPSPWKFMREIDTAAKNLLQAALAEANEARQETYDGASVNSNATVKTPSDDSNSQTQEAAKSERFKTRPCEEASGMAGLREVCCICLEKLCTIEVQDCGHQMCAVCTLRLCCHSKPNPAILHSPLPACPFCRRNIGRLVLARTEPSCKSQEETDGRKIEGKRGELDGDGDGEEAEEVTKSLHNAFTGRGHGGAPLESLWAG